MMQYNFGKNNANKINEQEVTSIMTNKEHRKSILACLLAIATVCSVSACGSSDDKQNASTANTQENIVSDKNNVAESETDTQTAQVEEDSSKESGGRILIAYFTAAENSGVDAVSSASYSVVNGTAVGRVGAIADMIQENTGGDLFSIQTSVVYPAEGGELIDYAAKEQSENARPELTSHIENLDEYDVIFVGYPNWWYDMPMVMYSFFEEYDFSRKTIIPFNVHNGSRFSSTISTIQELEPDAVVIENGFTVNERNVPDAAEDVQTWLDGLNL